MIRSDTLFGGAVASSYAAVTHTRVWEQHCARMALSLPLDARLILDIGCGPGNSTAVLPRGAIGGDHSMSMLRLAKPRGVPLVCLDASDLPMRSDSLDAATFHSVLYLLPDARRTLRETSRALRSGGRAILLEPQSGARATLLGLANALPHPRWLFTASLWRTMSTFFGGYSSQELWGLLEEAGLRVLRIEETLGGLGLLAVAEKP
jgi:ubiquinone/menaquinone biosynthesis C-methylase UbiE